MGKLQLIYLVICWLSFGFISAYLAQKKGRSPFIWFSIGLMMGIFGIATLILMPKIEKNTPPPKPKFNSFKRSDSWLKMWYYLDPQHIQQGPFEFPDLIKTWKEKQINEATYVWGEGMKEWKKLSEQPELLDEFYQV
jgi:GYF domain 2